MGILEGHTAAFAPAPLLCQAMNADPWVHPNNIYTECQANEFRARNKWNQTHGRTFSYSMSNPPRHRQCPFMSWMAELPDDFMQQMATYQHQKAMKDFGSAAQRKKPLQIPKQLQPPRPPSSFSYEKELEDTREQLVATLRIVEEQLGRTTPATRTGARPQSATSGDRMRVNTLKSRSRPTSAVSQRPASRKSSMFDSRFDAAITPAKKLFVERRRENRNKTN